MLRRVSQPENNGHLRIKAFDLIVRKVFSGIEDESIYTGRNRYLSRNQFRNPAIRVRVAFAYQFPTTGRLNFQRHGNTLRRPSARSVEHMGRDSAH